MDDANTPLENSLIYIYDKEGHYLTEVITDKEGKCVFEVLPDTYLFKQIEGQPNHIIDDTLYRFKVDKDNRTFNSIITNERYKGRVAIQVKDKEDNPIEGFECGIYDENKKLIVNLKTNEKGQMGAKNLPLGTYYYKLKGKKKYVEFQIKEKDETIVFNIEG